MNYIFYISTIKTKIVLAGGSGYLGKLLINTYKDRGVEIVILTRGESKQVGTISYVHWDAKTLNGWTKELEGSTALINLVGKSVNCRYSEKNKKEIINSRVDATLVLGKAILNCSNPPKVWINAGSAAIFGNGGSEIKNESSKLGDGFSAEVCKEWENAFKKINTPHTRKIFLRIGLVFEKDAWVLKPFLNMVRWGLGGTIGTGEQYISWIHEEDFLNLITWVIEREDVHGVLHVSSPFPVTNREFMKKLRDACSISFGIPHPVLFVKIGAVIIGTEAELALTGRRVVSKILEEKKFVFKYPQLDLALHQLLGN